MTTGTELRAQGQDDVLAADTAAHRMYAAHVQAAIDTLIDRGGTWTAEDVRQAIERDHPGAQAHHPNVLPAVIGGTAGSGRIRSVGYRKATRASRRHSVLAIWTGVRT